jgi:hypothetical protein
MVQDGTSVSPFYLQVASGASGKWEWTMFDTDNISTTGFILQSTAAAALNTWTYVVGVYDTAAAQGLLYVNGVLQGTAAHSASWKATGHLTIGRGRWGGNPVDFFAGRIDDARTYRRALSATEITTLYNSGAAGAPTLGYVGLGQSGALQGSQQGQQASTSAVYTNAGNGYNPTRYSSPATYSEECWFNSASGAGTIMDFGNAANRNSVNISSRIHLTATGVVEFGSDSGTTNIIQSSPGYLDGNWHHVVATFSSTTGMALYLDGTLVGSNTYTGYPLLNGAWRWGGDTHNGSWPSPDYFTGRIDEVAVYGTVLSAQQVAWHYHANH